MNKRGTFEDFTSNIRKYLSEELCSKEYYTHIANAASQLPALSHGMLEFRLVGNDARVDFGVLVVPELGEMDALLEFHRNNNYLSPDVRDSWKRIIEFCDLVNDPKGLVWQNIQNIWIAFDLGFTRIPIPWIYFVITPFRLIPELNADLCKKILLKYGVRITKYQYSVLLQLLKALPSKVQMQAFGYLDSRSQEVLRFTAKSFNDFKSIDTFLESVNWPLNLSPYKKLLSAIIQEAEGCQLLLDIGETLIPRIGIELWLQNSNNLTKSRVIMDRLVLAGLCQPEIKGHLLNWISETDGEQNILRWINHFKLTFEVGKPILPKAYLSFRKI